MFVSRNIHIAAPAERVFALMCDPLTRTRLNPEVVPIRIEIEDNDSPETASTARLHAGSVCHYRLQAGNHIVDYRMRVREFVPNRRIVSVSDSDVPFEITVETASEAGGTRLTQSERFAPTDEMLQAAAPDRATGRLLDWIDWLLPFLDLDYARRVHARREELLQEELEGKLGRWLEAIRRYLEDEAGEASAG